MGNRYTYKTLKQWCIENNRQDILDLWDYKLNEVTPDEVPAKTRNKYYFMCPNGIHDSEQKMILCITDKASHRIMCKQCERMPDNDRRENLTGKVFGELTAVCIDEQRTSETKSTYWCCQCSCGNIISTTVSKLKTGKKLICGRNNKHKRSFILPSGEIDIFNSQYQDNLRHSQEYKEYRKEVMKKDGYKCIICGSNDLEIHHIYPFAMYPQNRFNIKTGICLCKKHHSTSSPIGFHSIYGIYNNTPEQLEEYVNYMRNSLGITEYFDVYKYMEDVESDNLDIDDHTLDLYE